MNWWPWPNYVTREELEKALADLRSEMADEQSQIDALTAQANQIGTDLDATQTELQNQINALAAANPQLDFSGLEAAMAPLDAHVLALQQLQPQSPA